MSNPPSDSGVKEGAKAYVRAWGRAAPELEAVRLRELRQMTEQESARRFAELLQSDFRPALRPTSGLVEQQRIFDRLRTPRQ